MDIIIDNADCALSTPNDGAVLFARAFDPRAPRAAWVDDTLWRALDDRSRAGASEGLDSGRRGTRERSANPRGRQSK